MWKHKKCDEELQCVVVEATTKICTIKEDGTPNEIIKNLSSKILCENFYCKKCNTYYEDHVKLEEVAYWED